MYPILEDSQSIQKHSSDFGPKTTRLLSAAFRECGLPVYGISAQTLSHLCADGLTDENIESLASGVRMRVQTPLIIRSSGLHEDGEAHAHAGQYTSSVAHTDAEVAEAIRAVLTDAYEKSSDLSSFSLLIQPYILPTYTGVFFTRDPRGGLLSVIAWSKGATPHVVSGGTSSEHIFHRDHITSLPHSFMNTVVAAGYLIEAQYESAQDIEWIYDGNHVYIVQTRPITTVQKETYRLFKEIEDAHKHEHLYLERSGAAENYPHPVPLTYSLLTFLYGADGPIQTTYGTHGIRVAPNTPLVYFHGHLYTDKEAELRAFYPSHTYFGGTALQAHRSSFKGMWRASTNSAALARIATDAPARDTYAAQLEIILARCADIAPKTWDELRAFLTDAYTVVFGINLLTSVAESKTRTYLGADDDKLTMLLTLRHIPRMFPALSKLPIGNSLSTEDTTPFTAITQKVDPAAGANDWMRTLGEARKNTLIELLDALHDLQDLRERARIVSAWCAHHTRAYAEFVAQRNGVPKEHALFFTLLELQEDVIRAETVQSRATAYTTDSHIVLPSLLATLPTRELPSVHIISHGSARGYVVDEACLQKMPATAQYILYTETLRPDLVQYFPRICGIVASAGSTLSHLAIMAREAGIPVIIDPSHNLLTDGTYMMEFNTSIPFDGKK